MADIDRIRMEDIDITEERVRRKHQVTATHRPTRRVCDQGRNLLLHHAQRRAGLLEERVAELDGHDEDESD